MTDLYRPDMLRLDANRLPVGHRQARDSAIKLFQEMVNELPESVYHLNWTDAEWICSQVLLRYLTELERAQ